MVLNGYEKVPEIRIDNDYLAFRIPDSNLSTACNEGIKRSAGDYIIRLDADDTFHEDILKLESEILDDDRLVDAVWCNFNRVSDDAEPMLMDHPTLEHACGVMYRRNVFDKLGGYDESLKFQESFDFWLRFKKLGFNDVKLHQPLYNYRKHHGSMSTNIANRNQARIDILARHG